MKKVIMTFDEYDRLLEAFQTIELKPFWPTVEQVNLMSSDPERWMKFACFLNEQTVAPKTQDELIGKNRLREFILQQLELVDSQEEKEALLAKQKTCARSKQCTVL